MSNKNQLDELFKNSLIDIQPSEFLHTSPVRLPVDINFDRIEGMLFGLAIGDSLGNTNEGMIPKNRKTVHGEIRDFLPNRYADHKSIGLPSDDTQLAFWTVEQMIQDNGFNPEKLAAKFASGRIFGIGSTVREFLQNFKSGVPWYQCGPKKAGNGALMRIAPIIIPHLKTATSDLWVDATLAAMITHNDSGSISACIAFTKIFWETLKMNEPPQPEWWLKTYVQTARRLESVRKYKPRCRCYADFEGTISDFVEHKVNAAYHKGLSALDACDKWYSGAYLLETVPSVLFILMKHGHDPEEAIIRAVNDTKDNDTVAAIVGAAVGALHGKSKLPQRWISALSGRTREQDDGRVSELIEKARDLWA